MKFALGIPSVLSLFRPAFWSALSLLFLRDVSNRKSLKQKIGRYLIHYADNRDDDLDLNICK